MDEARASRMAKELLNAKVGTWRILEYLGAGKSALVFKAQNDSGFAALKIFDPELVERFGTAVQAARIDRELSLRGKHHPHLVRILDGGRCPSTDFFFVAMELLPGTPLSDRLKSVPRHLIWPIISQIANAAQFLENLNLVHRDIKPDNVFISDDFHHAWLLDFGVIRPVGEPGITDGEQKPFIGTLQYSSPEFLYRTEDDTPAGWRALTFYQIGAVLHDLIMQERIFKDQMSPFARLVDAVKDTTPRVEASDVPPELLLLARSCLSKEPTLRLRLVTWAAFDPHKASVASSSTTIDRIRRRQLLAKGTLPATPTIADQTNRMLRRKVDFVEEQVQALVRNECVGSGVFPPLQVFDWVGTRPEESFFVLTFDPSPEHALKACLQVWFSLKLIDQASTGISITVAASLSTSALSPTSTPVQGNAALYEGPFDQKAVEPRLQAFLYCALDQALLDRPTSGADQTRQIVWLNCDTGDAA
jgi:serine/threonine protein kinase